MSGERFVRSFELPLEEGWDGRTLETRVVPYNVAAVVRDPPSFHPYQEAFAPGAFERQLATPGRDKVLLNFEHDQGLRGVIGHSLEFHDRDDGLHAAFGIHENADGDKALDLIHRRVLTGLSLEFAALASRRVDGVVRRLRAHLDKVSLCRYPAFPGAEVLAVREEADEEHELLEPIDPASFQRQAAVDERLAALGFEALEDGMTAAALASAAKVLTRGRRGPEQAAEARKLIRHYRAASLEPPPALRSLAGAG